MIKLENPIQFDTLVFNLKKSLSALAPYVSKASTMPILETVLFDISDNGHYVFGTNSEVMIRTMLHNKMIVGGKFCVPLHPLLESIKIMNDDLVSVHCDGLTATFTSGEHKVQLDCMDYSDYPNTSSIDFSDDLPHVLVNRETFVNYSNQLAPLCDPTWARPVLACVKWSLGAKCEGASTNGHHLGVARFEADHSGDSIEFLLPYSSHKPVESMTDTLVKIAIDSAKDVVWFADSQTVARCNTQSGRYPDFNSVWSDDPNKSKFQFSVDVKELLQSLKFANVSAKRQDDMVVMNFDGKDKLLVSANVNDITVKGNHDGTIEAEQFGDNPKKIGFSGKLMIPALARMKASRIKFLLRTSVEPLIMCHENENGVFWYILMPMHTRK